VDGALLTGFECTNFTPKKSAKLKTSRPGIHHARSLRCIRLIVDWASSDLPADVRVGDFLKIIKGMLRLRFLIPGRSLALCAPERWHHLRQPAMAAAVTNTDVSFNDHSSSPSNYFLNRSSFILLTIRSATLRCPPRFRLPHQSERSPASPAQIIVLSLIESSWTLPSFLSLPLKTV
jgi:hypothetical protein